MSLLFGFHMPNYTFPGATGAALFDRVIESARAAEAAGFGLVTVMDHFYQIGGIGPETDPMLEAYATLSAIAAQTTKVKLSTLVTGVTYRNPAVLAKTVTTLDVISKGRAMLGIGAAWNESEHNGYGIPFPPIAERMERLDEAVTIAKLMFTEERPSFQGKHYRIDAALNSGGGTEDPDRRGWREEDPAHPGQARRHRSLVWRRPGGSEAQKACFRGALRRRRPGPLDRLADARRRRDPCRERARCEGDARTNPRGAASFVSRGDGAAGGGDPAGLRRRRMRRLHVQQSDPCDPRGDCAGR